MTATLPEWMIAPPGGLTADDYDALPEDVCRQIEIVDGNIVVSPSPSRLHQTFAFEFAHALRAAARPRYGVSVDVDLRLRDIPLLNRRPDIVVFDGDLPNDATLRAEHCSLVVEVMSPGSVITDQTDKPAEYAMAGVPHFWRVELDSSAPTLFRYRLDETTRVYVATGADTGELTVSDPFALALDLDELTG
ncbi:Uma2 family endonuclease [Herbihabitans rhizosphaerae]|uniref:Uma2 family endonuclease n=1 Tax=Herbihabitans rhizosphaerae TaxID=1872711 RepID=A0A4Q7KGR6_9PSEU|nr:Uma2 family endonuclease [Herbihabitans rhizosphaerae]RZS32776.1 Uma2 family endonuclease [Herbihabitans rhizosphaerae]